MKVVKNSKAGSLESCDLFVTIEPGKGTIDLEIESPVILKYGEKIKAVILNEIKKFHIESIKIRVVDRGALDHVIAARVETAIRRAIEEE